MPQQPKLLSISLISAFAASLGSAALITAPESDIPLHPQPASRETFASPMPPMATDGISTAASTSLMPSGPMTTASSLVAVPKAAPQPM